MVQLLQLIKDWGLIMGLDSSNFIFEEIVKSDTNFGNYFKEFGYSDVRELNRKKRSAIIEAIEIVFFALKDYNILSEKETELIFPLFYSYIQKNEGSLIELNEIKLPDELWGKFEVNIISFFLRFGITNQNNLLYAKNLKLFKESDSEDKKKRLDYIFEKNKNKDDFHELHFKISKHLSNSNNWIYPLDELSFEGLPLHLVDYTSCEYYGIDLDDILFCFQNDNYYELGFFRGYNHPLIYLYDYLVNNALFPGICEIEDRLPFDEFYYPGAEINFEYGVDCGYDIIEKMYIYRRKNYKQLYENEGSLF